MLPKRFPDKGARQNRRRDQQKAQGGIGKGGIELVFIINFEKKWASFGAKD